MSTSYPSTDDVKLGAEHIPFDASLWTGRAEPDESQRALYWYQVVAPSQAADKSEHHSKVTLVGFACDQGVRRNLGRVGARHAPPAIRQAFAKLPITPVLQDKFSKVDYGTLLADAGDIVCQDNDSLMPEVLEQTQALYSQQVTDIINQGSLAIGLGGGHAIAYASYMGLWQALNGQSESNNPKIGIINFDAHLDIRNAPKGTSGTPFRQIAEHNQTHGQPFYYCAIGISQFSNTAALFDRADELGVTIISDDTCARDSWETIDKQLKQFIDQVDMLYVTIDMDAFPASVVPGVSAPAAKGISLDFAERCLEVIFASGKVKMADFAEINPTYDIDARSCKVTARLLALMIQHHLLLPAA
ncbi:formimidoylglutamase [Psychrobacter sp. H7-1]|uniref:formimidoylglutamase n=1 Tax=Psychrobacter sp. H7-1 TaxID=1569265 RepID=UPI0019180B8B|nr:formimidoylglutamase [Psychrobacter sp. H7-1]